MTRTRDCRLSRTRWPGTGELGDLRTGESYPSDQFSQLTVGSTPLPGQWIGPAVRMQASGQSMYLGFYYWHNGNPEVMLFLRNAGTGLGSALTTAERWRRDPAEAVAVGNTISFQVNGVERIGVSDGTLTGGAPGILASGTADGGHLVRRERRLPGLYASTDSSGVKSYSVISDNNGDGPQSAARADPDEPGRRGGAQLPLRAPGRGRAGHHLRRRPATLEALDAQDQYNVTIIEPTFAHDALVREQPERPANCSTRRS